MHRCSVVAVGCKMVRLTSPCAISIYYQIKHCLIRLSATMVTTLWLKKPFVFTEDVLADSSIELKNLLDTLLQIFSYYFLSEASQLATA